MKPQTPSNLQICERLPVLLVALKGCSSLTPTFHTLFMRNTMTRLTLQDRPRSRRPATLPCWKWDSGAGRSGHCKSIRYVLFATRHTRRTRWAWCLPHMRIPGLTRMPSPAHTFPSAPKGAICFCLGIFGFSQEVHQKSHTRILPAADVTSRGHKEIISDMPLILDYHLLALKKATTRWTAISCHCHESN